MAAVLALGSTRAAPLPSLGTDGAEQIGVLVTLIGWQARSRAGLGSDPGAAVLLAEPGFILEPDLDWLAVGQMAYVGRERAREVLWNGPPPPAGPLD